MFNFFLAYIYFCGGIAGFQIYNELNNSKKSDTYREIMERVSEEVNLEVKWIQLILIFSAVMTGWVLIPVIIAIRLSDYRNHNKENLVEDKGENEIVVQKDDECR